MSVVLVGSENPVKLRAVRRALEGRPDLPWSASPVEGLPAASAVSAQPTDLDETFQGARNRSEWVHRRRYLLKLERPDLPWDGDDLCVGIESGLFSFGSARMDLCVVRLFFLGGSSFGTSSGFQLPDEVGQWLTPARVAEGRDLNDACQAVGLTTSAKLGSAVGLVGLLSGGALTREDYTVEAVRNALFGLRPRFG